MRRLAVLSGLVAFIWFMFNDSPGVTTTVSLSPNAIATSFTTPLTTSAIAPAATSTATASNKMIFAQAQTKTERSTQNRETRKPKAPTRIRVYDAGAIRLGPNAVRSCTDWYAEERRPSGTVIVPHMRCRWVRR
jgi:hypothetical protein